MIKAIAKIKGLGVFENYAKPVGTSDFGIKNLIYGWNYSGKTTLSRIFAMLENKQLREDFSNCAFTLETDGTPIDESNFQQSALIVRVFNADFVKENLQFESSNPKPILLLGKESETAQKEIDRLSARVKKAKTLSNTLISRETSIANLVGEAKKEQAKLIRQLLKLDPYTATHLSRQIDEVQLLGPQLLSNEDLAAAQALALTPDSNKPTTVETVQASLLLDALRDEAISVLAATPNFSNTLKHLEQNFQIEQWVETGLHLHETDGSCHFCGNTLTADRLVALQGHFSKEFGAHKQLVTSLLARVKAAKITIVAPKEVEFNPQFRPRTKELAPLLPVAVDAYNTALERLANDIQRKLDAPRKVIEPSASIDGLSQSVVSAITNLNALITENNELATNFTNAREQAIRRVTLHYVQEFNDSQERAGHERKQARLRKMRARLRNFAEGIAVELEKQHALISRAHLGREKINERLSYMLGSEALQIKVTNDGAGNDQFRLVRRDGKIAKNLSDGERTAIAFSYFLTKLQELKPDEYKQTVVYIDDPISSLDANHIFQVTAAIRTVFFQQNNENEPWKTSCKQLFISTHNFEFFNLLREIKPREKGKGARLYLIKRVGELTSNFCDMPKSLAHYQSEYHFLFDVIYRFHQAPNKTDYADLMLLPNAVRRFVELYTYSRLPGVKDDTVNQRAEELFGDEKAHRILKVLHHFSHGNTMDRLIGNSELIFDLEYAVRDLFEAIREKDEKHMDALLDSVKP